MCVYKIMYKENILTLIIISCYFILYIYIRMKMDKYTSKHQIINKNLY